MAQADLPPEAQSLAVRLEIVEAQASAVAPILAEVVWVNASDRAVAIHPSVPTVCAPETGMTFLSVRAGEGVLPRPLRIHPGAEYRMPLRVYASPRVWPEAAVTGTLGVCCYLCLYTKPGDAPEPLDQGDFEFAEIRFSAALPLCREGVAWFDTDYGTQSLFFRHGDDIYCSGGRDHPFTLLEEADAREARAVTRSLLLSGGKLFWKYHRVKRAPKAPLHGLSDVFYRAGDKIMTTYGDAKIVDPSSFEVLDTGLPSVFSDAADGYRCSYARDATAAYCFSEDTSPSKANVVRSCKSFATLESLGYSYARDIRSVYLEGRRVAGADGGSFELLNSHYSRDRNGIWLNGWLLEDVDPVSFEVLPDTTGRGSAKGLENSEWGRDAKGCIRLGDRETEADYLAYLARYETG